MCFHSRYFFSSAGQISSIPKYWTLEVSVFVGDFEGVSAILFLWVIFCYQAQSVTGVGASRNGDKLATLSWNLGSHKPQSPNFPPTPFQLYSDSSSSPKDNSLTFCVCRDSTSVSMYTITSVIILLIDIIFKNKGMLE